MKAFLVLVLMLVFATGAFGTERVKIMGTTTKLNDSILADVRRHYQEGSFPGRASVVPQEVQRRVMDLVGLNLALSEVACASLKFVEVAASQKSDDLKFSTSSIVRGHFDEIWVFDSCGTELRFQVVGTHRGKKLEKIVVVQTNSFDPSSGTRMVQTMSF